MKSTYNWKSIGVSAAILCSGIIGGYYLNQYLATPVVTASSKLGTVPQTADAKQKPMELKQLISETQKKVVSIETTYQDGSKGQGSGFLYNERGDIITNAHVVLGAGKIVVKGSDTSLYSGKLIGISEEKDIAVVRVEGLASQEPLVMADTPEVDIGEKVIAFGSPHGLDNTVTTGIISGLNRDFTIENSKYKGVYQISAPITHGNSGGPLVLENTGEVIGINSAGRTEGTIGFSIPVAQVLAMVKAWSDHPDAALVAESSSIAEGQLSYSYSEETFAEEAKYLIYYFYESVNARDYVTAYSVLGSDWQSKLVFDDFQKGYLKTVSVELSNMMVQSSTDHSATISVIIQAVETQEGNRSLSSYKLTYDVALENSKVKLIKGTGKRL